MTGEESQGVLEGFVQQLSTPACYVRGNRIRMNPAAGQLLGFPSAEETSLEQWFSTVYGQLAEHARMLYSVHRSLGLSQPITLPVAQTDGRPAWVQLSFHLSGEEEIWFLSDVARGTQTWNRLTGAEARWHALVESLPGWVTQVDLDGTITWISHVPDGRAVDQVLGRNIAEFLRLKHSEQGLKLIEELARDPHPACLETDEVLPDGRHVYHEHYVGPLMDQGRCVGFVVHSIDATERHRREQLMREQELQLMQSRKMEALGRMAGGVAHDLNNLLTVISGNLQILAQGITEGDPRWESLADMQQAIDEAANLVRQLLALSRGYKLNPTRADLSKVLQGLKRLLRSQLGPRISFVVEATKDVPPVLVDVGQMSQVITNLVLNARDAMPQGGFLRLSLDRLELESDLVTEQVIIPAGVYAVLHVADTGCGMDEETKAHLFEPFYTTKQEGHGTGLGLAVVYGIVQQSRGYIWFETELGAGTTFHVALPAVE